MLLTRNMVQAPTSGQVEPILLGSSNWTTRMDHAYMSQQMEINLKCVCVCVCVCVNRNRVS